MENENGTGDVKREGSLNSKYAFQDKALYELFPPLAVKRKPVSFLTFSICINVARILCGKIYF